MQFKVGSANSNIIFKPNSTITQLKLHVSKSIRLIPNSMLIIWYIWILINLLGNIHRKNQQEEKN